MGIPPIASTNSIRLSCGACWRQENSLHWSILNPRAHTEGAPREADDGLNFRFLVVAAEENAASRGDVVTAESEPGRLVAEIRI